MSVWSEVRATTTETRRPPSGGRAGRASIITIITATLMLLAGLVSPVGAVAPDAPTIDSATPTNQSVSVAFTPGADNGTTIIDHTVTLTPTAGGALISDSSATSPLVFPAVVPGTYNATVVTNSNDESSAASAPVQVVVAAPATAPDAPTAPTLAVTDDDKLTITWTLVAPANNGGSPITGYQYRLNGAGAWSNLTGPAATTATTGSLAAGNYTAQVRAVNAIGNSDASPASAQQTIVAPATVPGAPTIGNATLSGTSGATVRWFAPADNGGSAITGYQVSTDNGGWTSAGTASPFIVTGLAAGDHTFRIRAVNAQGAGAASGASNAITVLPAAPGDPGVPQVSNNGNTINISWAASSGVVDGYTVTLQRSGAGVQTQNPTSNGATFTNQQPGTYTVTVTAQNAGGTSNPTNAPFTLTLTATAVANVNAAVNTANTQVVVTWDPPADDGGGVAEYVVSLNPSAAPSQTIPGTDTRSATFSGLAGGDYTVSVVAVNAGGTSPAGTDTFEIVVAPGAPLNVKTTKPSGVRVATVTWDPPANNGNGTISGYVIKMGGKTKTVGADVRTVSFADLPIGTLTATVQAQNAQGLSAAGSSPEFASERPVHPFESRQAFVQQAFRDLFDRSANAAEQTYWTNLTAPDGSNGANVVEAMMRSELFETRRQISRLYFAYFLRVPDAAGQNYWADLMDRGVIDLQGVSDEFARSAEFVQTYGSLDDAEFVVVVYNNVLLRTPDIVGFNYWLRERQAGLTRGGVMTWFTEGEEFKNLSLSAIDTSLAHITMLDRSPTTSEYRVWVNRINNNASDSLVTLLDAIWNSDEYAARVTPG